MHTGVQVFVSAIAMAVLCGAAGAVEKVYTVTAPVIGFEHDAGSIKAVADPNGGKRMVGGVEYRFDAGAYAFAESHTGEVPIPGEPTRVSVDVYGDGSGMVLRFRMVDANHECYQVNGPAIDWKGWRTVDIPITSDLERWGGDGNGRMDLPMSTYSFVLIHPDGSAVTGGRICLRNLRVTTRLDRAFSAYIVPADDLSTLPRIRVENLLDAPTAVRIDSALERPDGTMEKRGSARYELAPHEAKEFPWYSAGPKRLSGEIALARASVVGVDGAGRQNLAAICGTPKPVGAGRASVFGMNVHLERYSQEDAWKLLQMLRKAGVTGTRVEMGFAAPDPKLGYSRAVRQADWVVLANEAFGIDSMGCMSYFPPEFYKSPEKLRMAHDWAAALAERFKGRVYSWQYGNETNSGWGAYGAAADMAALNEAFASGTLSVDPHAKTGTLGVAEGESGYVRAMYAEGVGEYMRAACIHPYGGTAEATIGQCLMIRRILGESGHKQEIWADEVGVWVSDGVRTSETTGQLVASNGLTEDQQADHLVRLYTLAKAKAIDRVYWYDFFGRGDPETFWIVDGSFRPRPAYTCLCALSRAIADAAPIGGTDIDELVQRQYFRKPDGSVTLIAWALRDGVKANLNLPRRLRGKDFTGKTLDIPARSEMTLGGRPLLIEGLKGSEIGSFLRRDVLVNALDARSFEQPQHRWLVEPGKSIDVPCVMYNSSSATIHAQPVLLRTQPGWSAEIPSGGEIGPGRTMTGIVRLTCPANAVTGAEYRFELAADVNGLSRSLPYRIRVKTSGSFPYDDYLADRGRPEYAMWDSLNEAGYGVGRSEYQALNDRADVDGDLREWSPSEFYPIDQKARGILRDPWVTDRLNWTGRAAMRWDGERLYAAFLVIDDDLSLLDFTSRDWRDTDYVRLFLSVEPDEAKRTDTISEKDFSIHFAPTGIGHSEPPVVFCSSIGGYVHTGVESNVDVASRVWSGGYLIEASVPWRSLGYTPAPGSAIGLNILAMDADCGHRQCEAMTYFKNPGYWNSPKSLGKLTLIGK